MADAPPSQTKRYTLSTSSDAMEDATESQTKRYTLSTGSDTVIDTLQFRNKRISLSKGSDEMTNSPQDERYTLYAGSDVILELKCNPCDNNGDVSEAEGYCKDCSELLCKSCIRYHKMTKTTKRHKILDKSHMPIIQPTQTSDYICTQPCNIHRDEFVKYYCPSHKVTGCGDCMISTHVECTGKYYIPDKTRLLDGSKEYKDFKELISDLTAKSELIVESLDSYAESSADFLSNALHDIEVFQQEINIELDKCKATILEKMKDIPGQNKTVISTAVDQTRQNQAEMLQMSAEIQTLLDQNQHYQAFIEMKNLESKLTDYKQQLEDADAEHIGVTTFWFQPNEDLQKQMKGRNLLGKTIVKKNAEISATHVTDIKINTTGYKCWISGSTVLSKNRLVITDWKNDMMQLIDTEHKLVISEFDPGSSPCDVDRVNARQVVTTLPDVRKILLIGIEDNRLKLDKEISVDHQCRYIGYTDNQLVAGCSDPPAVLILSMTGEVLRTIAKSSKGKKLFMFAPHLTVSPLNKAIYALEDHVVKLGMDGTVHAQYKDTSLMHPVYTAIDEQGLVYIIDRWNKNIHVLTPGCSKLKVILTERDMKQEPCSLSYCQETHRFYVGSRENNTVMVYQLS